jgi:hypothetical protein
MVWAVIRSGGAGYLIAIDMAASRLREKFWISRFSFVRNRTGIVDWELNGILDEVEVLDDIAKLWHIVAFGFEANKFIRRGSEGLSIR